MTDRKKAKRGSGLQRRVFLTYKSARYTAFANDFGPSWAWEHTARNFGLTIRHVKYLVEEEKCKNAKHEEKKKAKREAERGGRAGDLGETEDDA